MTLDLFARQPATGFRCLLFDPPWEEHGGGGRGAQNHYDTMSVAEMRLMAPHVRRVTAANAHCWMWTTDTFLPDALDLLRLFGFRYVRTVVWVKTTKGGGVHPGWLGYYARGAHELCLLGVRGSLPVPTANRSPSAFLAPKGKHSRKPAAFYDVVEAASPDPRLEVFARRARPGWFAIGNETSGGDVIDDLARLAENLPTIVEPGDVDDLPWGPA